MRRSNPGKRTVSMTLAAAALAGAAAGGADAANVQTLAAGNTLVTFNSATPGTIASSVAISGVTAGTTLRGIDYRPASPRVLYAISNVGQLYAINARTGSATSVGTPALPPISSIGFDFNPTVDRIRVVTQIGQNVRINPDTGALAATDGALAYSVLDGSTGQIPTVAGAAYTNNVAGATSTTLYVIDTRGGLAAARLATQGKGTVSPNSGTLFTVGSTGVTTASSVGFDISRDGVAYATLTDPVTGTTSLYTINLATGAATSLGALSGNKTYDGLAVELASFASMGATANQAAVGAALDNFTGLPSGQVLSLFNAIDGLYATPAAQSAALLALSPAAYSSLPDLSLNAVQEQETAILRYTRDLRGNATMPDGSTATLDAAGRFGAWLLGGSRFGKFDDGADRPGVRSSDYNILGGADFRLTPTVALGGFGGYSKSNVNLALGGSRGKLKSAYGGGYGTAAVGPIYVDAWGSYTDLKWGLTRVTSIGSFSDTTNSFTTGRVWSGGAATGLSFALGGAEVEPFAAFRYSDIRIDSFNEIGGVTALSISEFDRVSMRTNLGARVGGKLDLGGATVRPQVHGGWYHEFRDQPRTINASFLDSSIAGPFGFTTTPLKRDYYNAGTSLTIAGHGPLSLSTDYDVQFDKDRQYHSFTLSVRMAI